jgi:hypothetical protein
VPVPLTGLHLDLAAQRVSVWGYQHPDDGGRNWPGWQMDFRADRFADHNAVCGLPVSQPLSLNWAYAGLRASLTGSCADESRNMPPARLVDCDGGSDGWVREPVGQVDSGDSGCG